MCPISYLPLPLIQVALWDVERFVCDEVQDTIADDADGEWYDKEQRLLCIYKGI